MAAKWIAIDDVRADGGTQTRAELRPDIIEEYAEAMRRGDEFPPIDVFLDKAGNYWLADGFHRFNGAASAEMESILATIHKGELRDAIWFALSANYTNGLRRTNEDKRRCVKLALSDKQWSLKTDQALADHVGVHVSTVNRLRDELSQKESSREPPKRKGKDGKSRPAKYKPREKKAAAKQANATYTVESDSEQDDAESNKIGDAIERVSDLIDAELAGMAGHEQVVFKERLRALIEEI